MEIRCLKLDPQYNDLIKINISHWPLNFDIIVFCCDLSLLHDRERGKKPKTSYILKDENRFSDNYKLIVFQQLPRFRADQCSLCKPKTAMTFKGLFDSLCGSNLLVSFGLRLISTCDQYVSRMICTVPERNILPQIINL